MRICIHMQKRAQILMDPVDYKALEAIARRRNVSVGQLVREAVHDRYLAGPERRRAAVDAILELKVPLRDWEQEERDLEESRGGPLP